MEDFNNLPHPSHTDDELEYADLDYSKHKGVNLDEDYEEDEYANYKHSNINQDEDDQDEDEEGEIQDTQIEANKNANFKIQNSSRQNKLLEEQSMIKPATDKQFQLKRYMRINNVDEDEFEEGETDDKILINKDRFKKQLTPEELLKKESKLFKKEQLQKKVKMEQQQGYSNRFPQNFNLNKMQQNYRKDYAEEKKDPSKLVSKSKTVLTEDLTFEEAEQLLEAWRKQNFVQFNNWIQVSKSILRQDYPPHQSGYEEEKEKGQITGYSCNLTLKFNYFRHGNISDFVAVGFGKRKQDAKRMALERLVVDLIQTGTIRLGLRDKNFLHEQPQAMPQKENNYLQQMAKPKPRTDFEEKIQESNQKRARKLSKKLQDYLRKQNIAEAINCLREIGKFKTLEWNEISFIWSHGVIHQNAILLQQILDIINKKPVGETSIESNMQGQFMRQQEEVQTSKDFVQKYDEDRVKQKLFLNYGITRQKACNPHDVYDLNSIEFSEKEILTSGLPAYNDDEFNKELVRDPFIRDLQDILVPVSNNETISCNSPLRTVYEMAQKWPMRHSDVLFDDSDEKYIDDEEDDLFVNKVQPKLKFLKDYDMNSQNYQKIAEAIFGKKGFAKRENSVPAVLLDELYETLLYSGDKQFSLEIAEKIYTQLQLETSGFVHESSADYYAQKKNMIITEAIDCMYESIQSRNPIEYLCNINGKIEKIGTAHCYDVVAVTPLETQECIDQKLLKKCKYDVRETHHMIVEGDIVILTTFFRPSYDKPVLDDNISKLALYINQRAKSAKDNRDFIHNITEFGNVVEFALIGQVREMTKDSKMKVFICPTYDQSKSIAFDSQRQWKITKIFSRTQHERMQDALRIFCFENRSAHPAIMHTICTPPGQSSNIIKRLSNQDQYKATNTKTQLNAEQQLAVEKAALNRITVIQGPPGSGKTTTAVEIVLEWLRASNQPILITAESQGTVNIIYGELIKANVKAVTIGPGFEDRLDHINEIISKPDGHEPIQKLTSKDGKHLAPKPQEYIPNSMKFLILKKMLREAQVVCCTCQTVMADYLKGLHFTRVIIDEANTVSEPLSLIPIHRLCNQLVLIGDHMQSSPKSQSMFAQSKGMCMSLFEKLISQGFKPHLLKTQYRVAANQMIFQSRYFYNNMLENGIVEEFKPELRGFPWPNPAIKSCVIFVKGQEQATQLIEQLQNPKEAEVVVEILLNILKAGYIKQSDIGIVTTFDEQKKRIRSEINTQAKKHPSMFSLTIEETLRITKHSTLIDIETVEKANLMDKELIIFSPVRSNKHKAMGILRDPRLINTVLWSGKRGIIIIADIDTLGQDPHWKEYYKWAKMNNLILQYFK
ncbi:hypothetical protein ABPG72_018930 [Tetrahymena utriculariae]